MRMVLLGPPGAGKGTQAKLLCERYDTEHVSSGDMLRERIASGTATGLRAKPHYDAGKLVPDQIMVDMVLERLGERDCAAGFLLDGFPRTRAQAAALDGALAGAAKPLTAVVELQVDDEDVLRRLGGRRICESCAANYHVEFLPPRETDRCDRCRGELIQRADDQPETIRRRLRVYHEQTAELVGYYKERSLLRVIRGTGTVQEIHSRICAALGD